MKKIMLIMALVFATATSAIAQVMKVTGEVMEAGEDQPIIGATVKVVGAKQAVVTDIDGRFSLTNIKPGQKIEFSLVGFETQVLEAKPEMKVYLSQKVEIMDEVIVVAFGKQKRESFTGSASVVTSADITRQQVSNPIEALQGNVPGLQMLETNSFSSDPSITIRGLGSINANTAPLIVLDGLPYNGYWNDINPADVASMTVLKDAASNALYGARGANGVILITTKNAERGATKVSVSAKWGVNTNARIEYDLIDNPGQYYEAYYMGLKNYFMNVKGQGSGSAHLSANQMLTAPYADGGLGYNVYTVPANQQLIGSNGKLNPNAVLGNRVAYNGEIYTLLPDDWTKEGMRNSLRQEYNLSISGGNDRYTNYISLGYLKDQGLSYNNDLERFTARIKTDYKAYSFLRVGANASYNYSLTNSNRLVFDAFYDIAPIYPLYVRDADGNIRTDAHGKVYDYGVGNNGGMLRPLDNQDNYIQDDLLNINRNSSNAFNLNGYATIDILPELHLTVNGNIYITENRMQYTNNPYYGYTALNGGWTGVYHYRTTNINAQQLLNYSKQFGKHNIDVLVGHEYSRDSQTELYGTKTNLVLYESTTELDAAIVNGTTGSNLSKYNVEGWFGRAQYDYESRYFASGSFRRDGSSNFHPSHRWGNFWSLGAAWIMTKEEWMPKNSLFNMLKFKLSYGEQGNDGIGYYKYTDTYSISNQNGNPALIFDSKGNPNITWETVGSLNAGVEFEMLNSRISGGVEFYTRTTRNMLTWYTTPSELGYTGYYDNVGNMNNKGIEINLNGDIIASKAFTWTLGLNFTWEHNRITSLPEDKKQIEVDGHYGYQSYPLFYGENLPMYTWYIRKYAGVAEDGQALYYLKNEDGSLGQPTTDYQSAGYFLCGTALPKMFGGFNTTFKAFGFDLTAQFNYSIGGKKYDTQYQSFMSPAQGTYCGYAIHVDVFDSWSPDNTTSNIPRYQYGDQYTAGFCDRFLTDASYLNLRNVTFGYTFPKSLVRKLKMQNLRIFATAENVYYWTKRKGFDPRSSRMYGSYRTDSYGSNDFSFPRRTISGGLSIDF